MTVSNPDLVTILVLLMAGLVLLQSVALAIALFRLEKRIRQVTMHTKRLAGVVADTLNHVSSALQKLNSVPTHLRAIDETLNSVTQRLFQGLTRADSNIGATLELSHRRIEEINRRIDFGLSNFVRQTGRIQRQISIPWKTVSAVFQGFFAGLRAFRAGRRNPTRQLHDEESFI